MDITGNWENSFGNVWSIIICHVTSSRSSHVLSVLHFSYPKKSRSYRNEANMFA